MYTLQGPSVDVILDWLSIAECAPACSITPSPVDNIVKFVTFDEIKSFTIESTLSFTFFYNNTSVASSLSFLEYSAINYLR
nr:MAG: hypothetical protein [Bacteriophage sp.]